MWREAFNVRVPFFRPVWRRVVVVVLVAIWTVFEFARGAPVWGVLFAVAGGYLAWCFFFAWRDPDDDGV